MTLEKTTWTERDIANFTGQEESLRLEFKAGALLDKPESTWVDDLSKQTSAFANTEGGVLVLGLTEERIGKNRVAGKPDGVPDSFTRDQIQRKIEGNVFPYLSGLRIHRVPLQSLPGKVVYVLQIPAGTTAYQAKDGRYYGRSELEVKHLPDHEIRIRMERGKVPRARLAPVLEQVTLARDIEKSVRAKNEPSIRKFENNSELSTTDQRALLELIESTQKPNSVRFKFSIENDGEITIRDPILEVSEFVSCDSFGHIHPAEKISRSVLSGKVIYPGDRHVLASQSREFYLRPDGSTLKAPLLIKWKIFLDNSPPSMGELDLREFLQSTSDAVDRGTTST